MITAQLIFGSGVVWSNVNVLVYTRILLNAKRDTDENACKLFEFGWQVWVNGCGHLDFNLSICKIQPLNLYVSILVLMCQLKCSITKVCSFFCINLIAVQQPRGKWYVYGGAGDTPL